MARQALSDWIRENLNVSILGSDDKIGVKKCTAFSLVHMQGNQQVELKTISIGSKQWEPRELASLFDTAAETFAGGVPGVQQFQVLAFYDDKDKPQGFYPLRKNGESEAYGLGTEPPTTVGLTQQLMRHNEALARLSASHSDSLLNRQSDIIEKLLTRMGKLEEENFDTVELAKELIMKQAADQHTRAIELIKTKQSAEDRKALMRLAPPLANKLLGREIFPQSAVDTSIIENLAESLDEKQIMALSQVLKPEQFALIADRMVDIIKKRKEAGELTEGKKDAAE